MEAAWRGKPLDDEVSRRILESAVNESGLPAQVVSPGSPVDDSLIAYIIESERGGPDEALDAELEKAAAVQLARELIAAVIRFLQTEGLTEAPERGALSVEVPVTGEPPTSNDLTVRGFKIVGRRDALGIAIHGPVSVKTSTETEVTRDTGEVFNAFMAGGAVHRLTVGLRVDVVDENGVAVVATD